MTKENNKNLEEIRDKVIKICEKFHNNMEEYKWHLINFGIPFHNAFGVEYEQILCTQAWEAYQKGSEKIEINQTIPGKLLHFLAMNNYKDSVRDSTFIEDGFEYGNEIKISADEAAEIFYSTLVGFEFISE